MCDSSVMRSEIAERQARRERGEVPDGWQVQQAEPPLQPRHIDTPAVPTTLSDEAMVRWNHWLDSRVNPMFQDFKEHVIIEGLGQIIGDALHKRDDEIDALRKAVGTLRAELTLIQNVQQRGTVTELRMVNDDAA